MPWLIEVEAAWFIDIFTSNILLVFSQSDSKWPYSPAHILAFRKVFAFILLTFPIVNAILCLAVDCISDVVDVPSHLTSYLGGGGEGKGAASSCFLATLLPSWGIFFYFWHP